MTADPKQLTDAQAMRVSLTGSLLGLAGVAVSTYATYHHLLVKQHGSTDASCNISAELSCDAVALSSYSEFLQVPMGIWGIGYFLALITSCWFMYARKSDRQAFAATYGLFVLVGVLASLSLAGISLFVLKTGCPTCIAVYVVVALQLVNLISIRPSLANLLRAMISKHTAIAASVVFAVALIFTIILPIVTSSDQPSTTEHTHQEGDELNLSLLGSETHDIDIAKTPYTGLGEDFRKGSDSAKVVLVKFSDFQCPACGSMAQRLDRLSEEFGQRILIVYRNYPLDSSCNPAITRPLHKFACRISELARCAGRYDKFWQFHNQAFSDQAKASEAQAKLWAQAVGLSNAQIDNCLKDPSISEKIKADIDLGNQLGVNATPTIFINGRKFLGSGFAALRHEVLSQLEL